MEILTIELGDDVVGVDEHRVRDALGSGPDLVDVLVDRDCDHLEVVVSEFVLEFLPTWQVEDAPSPTGERDEQSLLRTMVGQRVRRTVEVG